MYFVQGSSGYLSFQRKRTSDDGLGEGEIGRYFHCLVFSFFLARVATLIIARPILKIPRLHLSSYYTVCMISDKYPSSEKTR